MAREYRILHHRQIGIAGGHWDMVENCIPHRAAVAAAPHGDGSLCAALEHLSREGWEPVMELIQVSSQSGESFILIGRALPSS
jgi:hypothetical protein